MGSCPKKILLTNIGGFCFQNNIVTLSSSTHHSILLPTWLCTFLPTSMWDPNYRSQTKETVLATLDFGLISLWTFMFVIILLWSCTPARLVDNTCPKINICIYILSQKLFVHIIEGTQSQSKYQTK